MISSRQIRAARALLGWTVNDLAAAADLARETLNKLENGHVQTREGTMERIVKAFDSAGVEFTESEGVRIKPNEVEIFIGPERFQVFLDYLYRYLDIHGGEVCISVTDERKLQAARKNTDEHRLRMKSLVDSGRVSGRILAVEGNFIKTWADLRRQPKTENMPQVSFYAFGDCLALISFQHTPSPYVVLHRSGPFAEAYRQAFNVAWEGAEEL